MGLHGHGEDALHHHGETQARRWGKDGLGLCMVVLVPELDEEHAPFGLQARDRGETEREDLD